MLKSKRHNLPKWVPLARYIVYAAGVAVLAGMLAAVYFPMGHPWVVWLSVTGVLAAVGGLSTSPVLHHFDRQRQRSDLTAE
jgi:hypothetical protein